MAASLPAGAFAQSAPGEADLIAAELEETGIVFHVPSGGCTSKADFGVEPVKRQPLTIRLVRIRPDVCQGLVPKGIAIRFSYAEMGAASRLDKEARRQIVILNETARTML
jgi:hypothetical protein